VARKVEVPGAGGVKIISSYGALLLALVTFGLYLDRVWEKAARY
jgi:hypothetical protein